MERSRTTGSRQPLGGTRESSIETTRGNWNSMPGCRTRRVRSGQGIELQSAGQQQDIREPARPVTYNRVWTILMRTWMACSCRHVCFWDITHALLLFFCGWSRPELADLSAGQDTSRQPPACATKPIWLIENGVELGLCSDDAQSKPRATSDLLPFDFKKTWLPDMKNSWFVWGQCRSYSTSAGEQERFWETSRDDTTETLAVPHNQLMKPLQMQCVCVHACVCTWEREKRRKERNLLL